MRCSTSMPFIAELEVEQHNGGQLASALAVLRPKQIIDGLNAVLRHHHSLVMLWLLSARKVSVTSSGLSSTSKILPGFTRPSITT